VELKQQEEPGVISTQMMDADWECVPGGGLCGKGEQGCDGERFGEGVGRQASVRSHRVAL
jgi:hypothetical protein